MTKMNDDEKKSKRLVRINYIHQLNSFRDISTTRHLKPSAIVLYEVLFSINNRHGFAEWFAATNDYLQLSAHITTWKAFNTARQALIDNGLILYVPGTTGVPGKYSLIKLYNPVPDSFKHDIELAQRAYNIMETKISMQLQTYIEKKEGLYHSTGEDGYKNDVPTPDENAGDLYAQNGDGTPCKIQEGASAKSTNINKINKQVNNIKINRAANDGLVRAKIQVLSPEIAEARRQRLQKHREWFESHTKTGSLSFKEETSLSLIESGYSAEQVETAMRVAGNNKKYTVGYVRSILEKSRR